MPNETVAPGEAESPALSLEESAAAALVEHQQAAEGEAPAPQPSESEQAEEPEHVRWAKSASGYTDPKTGQFDVDRVLKQAHELNKQNQAAAQQLAQVRQFLSLPETQELIGRLSARRNGDAAEATTSPEEKSDEDLLGEFVEERTKKLIEPLIERNQILYRKHFESELDLTFRRLHDEFGKDGDTYLYDTVRDTIGQQVAQAAQQAGVTVDRLLEHLVDRGILFDTLATAARNALFPTLRQKQATVAQNQQAAKVAQKQRARLTPSGTSTKQVKSDEKVDDFWDAVRVSKKQLGMDGGS